jgi:hypothetical protein
MTPTPTRSLSDLLTGYLANSPTGRWPGADGFLVDDVLREYPAAATARQVPGEVELCDRHPELAAHVVAFFFRHTFADGPHA